ncbi:MAG: hypothetical protein H6829_03575 [Planctomycetes bacterium]|nr:hypothetical protein [Planctomycetota bacterium]
MNARKLWAPASLLLALSIAACNASETQKAPEAAPAPAAEPSHKAITTAELEPYTCGTIQRMHTLGGVFLASQPAQDDFAQAQMGGVKTVINMRKPAEMAFDEAATVEGLGMAYFNPGWNGPEELTDEVFQSYRDMLNTAERPILLHCGSANRVGAVWLPWRVLDEGVSVDAALAEAKEVGLKTPEYEAKALDYIRRMQK